jgi:hypothetical protein
MKMYTPHNRLTGLLLDMRPNAISVPNTTPIITDSTANDSVIPDAVISGFSQPDI